jgi:hypothetical protein
MYFPNSQIKTNLYTNGGEYILSTTKKEYKGYYYKLANGKLYTGKSPNDKPNILLSLQPNTNDTPYSTIPTSDNDITINNSVEEGYETYSFLNFKLYPQNQTFIPRSIPQYNPTTPIQKDYDLGVFQRYFCKKNNELIYIEIDKTTFQQINSNNPQIAWDLYSAVSLNWYLKGDKTKTYNANKGLTNLIETQKKWHGFSQYFKDKYLKYYLES